MQYTNDEAASHWDMTAMKDLGRDLAPTERVERANLAYHERAWIVTFGGDLCFGPSTHDRCEVYLRGMRQAIHRLERQANS